MIIICEWCSHHHEYHHHWVFLNTSLSPLFVLALFIILQMTLRLETFSADVTMASPTMERSDQRFAGNSLVATKKARISLGVVYSLPSTGWAQSEAGMINLQRFQKIFGKRYARFTANQVNYQMIDGNISVRILFTIFFLLIFTQLFENWVQIGILWVYLGDIFWISSGYLGDILRISWDYLGDILGLYWWYLGGILGISWGYLEDILGISWGYLGDILGISWRYLEYIWGMSGVYLGNI